MKNFDWDEFKSKKIAIHCSTEKKANDFLNQSFEHGFTLLGSNHLFDNLYVDEEKNTCYRVDNMGCIFHSSLQFYCENNYKIIEWETNDMGEFDKEDIEVGMLVKTKYYDDCGYGMIMPSKSNGTAIIYKKKGGWDYINPNIITEVWGLCNIITEALDFSTNGRNLLYKKAKEMTMDEICKELGYTVKIVKK